MMTSQNHHCCLHIRRTQNLNFFSVSIRPAQYEIKPQQRGFLSSKFAKQV
jgi:hypothetical protein